MRQFGRLLAVDPSLTCSGWALFDISRRESQLEGVGKIRSLPADRSLSLRLLDLQEKISNTFDALNLARNDVLICEAPTTMRDPKAAFKVEQVRGIFEAIARSRKLVVPGRLNPRSVQKEVMGLRGAQLKRLVVKEAAVSIVKTVYGASLSSLGFDCSHRNLSKHQDIVDAILIGSLGLTRIQAAQNSGEELSTYFGTSIRQSGRRLIR